MFCVALHTERNVNEVSVTCSKHSTIQYKTSQVNLYCIHTHTPTTFSGEANTRCQYLTTANFFLCFSSFILLCSKSGSKTSVRRKKKMSKKKFSIRTGGCICLVFCVQARTVTHERANEERKKSVFILIEHGEENR